MTTLEKLRLGRLAATVLLLLLMAFMALETLFEPLPGPARAALAAILLLPLALFLRPLLRANPDGALWLSLLLMPYFCWALLGTFAPGLDGALALVRALLIAATFTALMLLVRWHRAAAMPPA